MGDDLEISHKLLASAAGDISLMLARRRARTEQMKLCVRRVQAAMVHMEKVMEILQQHGK